MSSGCDAGSCDVKGQTETCGSGSGECPCGTACGGDPVTCAMGLWTGSFFQAMKAAQVEALKAKIQKAWGAKMDKAADAVLEAMGTKWQSMLAEAQAKERLREKLSSLWQESK